MAETASNTLALGFRAPDFKLLNPRSKEIISLQDVKSPIGTVIVFLCNHCPYVKLILPKLIEVIMHYQQKDIAFIAINSNDTVKYPADSPEQMVVLAEEKKFTFPYLFDQTQQIAKAYQAACTPDFYLFDGNLQLIYHGRFDDATPGNSHPVTGKDLTQALNHLLEAKSPVAVQLPSLGCNIKWMT
jgi:peroxiredoxin